MNGIINVLKPPGMTSHDVVYFIRKRTGIKKVGHTGTLDPEAAGVLPVCIGKATKTVQYLTDKDKKYRACMKFGTITDTYDIYGKILSQNEVGRVDAAELENILKTFVGEIEQAPPIYSAIKKNGKKLYEYALSGETVDIAKRKVQIHALDLIDFTDDDEIMLDISCSKGTYVRSLCYDIGEKLGCGACMTQLIRTVSGSFTIEEAHTLEEIEAAASQNEISRLLLPVDKIFEHYTSINIRPTARNSALNGNPLYEKGLEGSLEDIMEGTHVRIYHDSEFIAIGVIACNSSEGKKYVRIENLFVQGII